MISPVIRFQGNCSEAIAFYEQVFDVTEKYIDYYKDAPSGQEGSAQENIKNLVMHSSLTFCGSSINLSDTQDQIITGNRYCLNVFYQTADEVCHAYEKLKEGGRILVELGSQFFSPMYGSVEDQFGIVWQLIMPMEAMK